MESESNILLDSAISQTPGDPAILLSLAPPRSPVKGVGSIDVSQQDTTPNTSFSHHTVQDSPITIPHNVYSAPVTGVTMPSNISISPPTNTHLNSLQFLPYQPTYSNINTPGIIPPLSTSVCNPEHQTLNPLNKSNITYYDESTHQNTLLQSSNIIPSILPVAVPIEPNFSDTLQTAAPIAPVAIDVTAPPTINAIADTANSISSSLSSSSNDTIPMQSTCTTQVFSPNLSVDFDTSSTIRPTMQLSPAMPENINSNSAAHNATSNIYPSVVSSTMDSSNLPPTRVPKSGSKVVCKPPSTLGITPSVVATPTPVRPSLCYTRILLGEITALLAAMRRATPRWSHHQAVS